jgi:hypothetical protein
MIASHEVDRVHSNVGGEQAPPVWVKLDCRSNADVESGLVRVRDVMELVARARGAGWPVDGWWEQKLPTWFLDSFIGHTLDDIQKNPMLWDFGSWLDAMKNPGWEWWSSSLTKNGWIINLSAFNDPYSVEPLGYLARAAGAESVIFSEP